VELGGAAALGLGLPGSLRARASDAGDAEASDRSGRLAPTADARILIILDGGPGHLDPWDRKPEAPSCLRGEFRPIASTGPGVSVCAHLPRLARPRHAAGACAWSGNPKGERMAPPVGCDVVVPGIEATGERPAWRPAARGRRTAVDGRRDDPVHGAVV
jgi:hypothetical protein